MLGEAHRRNTIDAYSQDSDEQMDKGDPVCKKRPRGDREYVVLIKEQQHLLSITVIHGGKQRKALISQMCDGVKYLWSSMSSICLLT